MIHTTILFVEGDSRLNKDNLEHAGPLMNCKQLVYDIADGFIVHLACDDLVSMNRAIIEDFAGIEGVTRITPLVIRQ